VLRGGQGNLQRGVELGLDDVVGTCCALPEGETPADAPQVIRLRIPRRWGQRHSWAEFGNAMTVNLSLTRGEQATVRGHLLALRTNLTRARDALMHFKGDRLDRDKLEPAARRVDDLVNLFAGYMPNSAQGQLWIGEVRICVEQVRNPKVADTLRDARADIAALLEVMGPEGSGTAALGTARLGRVTRPQQ